MLLSPEYRELNQKLHEKGNYGISGQRYANAVMSLCNGFGTNDVLDYGCGQRTLENALGFEIKNYDPCIPGLETTPEPADIVACTDVLEHVEPYYLDAVLDDLARLTKRAGFFVIANRPAKKFLEDGRNAHLIQEPYHWWRPRLASRWRILSHHDLPGEFMVVVVPK